MSGWFVVWTSSPWSSYELIWIELGLQLYCTFGLHLLLGYGSSELFNESLAHYCLFSTKRTVEISTFHINLALQFPAFCSFKIWQISWVGVLPRSAIANSKNCKTVIGDCLYQFINPSRASRLPAVILMNTPTSELFFWNIVKLQESLLCFEGFWLRPLFSSAV